MGFVLFWGLLAHAYGFLHSSFSHDVLNAFIATPTEEAWKIGLGRFLVPIYRFVFRGPVTLPWLIGILGLTWTSVALFLVIRFFDIQSSVLIFLIAGLMTTNITYIAQIATYIYEFDVNAFALMLSVLSAYLWSENSGIFKLFASAVCLMCTIGLYQAYFSVTVTLIIFRCIMNLFADVSTKQVFLHGLKGIGIILSGGCLYLLFQSLICCFTGIQLQSRVNVLSLEEPSIFFFLNLVAQSMRFLVSNIFHRVYRNIFFIVIVLLVLGLLALSVIDIFKEKKYKGDKVLLIIALIIFIPFAMTSTYFLAKGKCIHDLTTYSIWFFYIFIGILSFWICEKKYIAHVKKYVLKILTCILIGTVLWQNVIQANTAYIKKELESTAILSTMTNVIFMIEHHDEYVPGKTEIAFVGNPQNVPFPLGMGRVSNIIGLQNNSVIPSDGSTYYYNAYKAYFSYVLQQPVKFCDDDVHDDLKKDKRVKILPSYPQKGCIEMIDEVLVIKMGN